MPTNPMDPEVPTVPTEEEGKTGGHTGEHEMPEVVLVTFCFLVTLLVAAACRELKKMTGIPFAPILLVAGCLLGGYTQKLGLFGKGLESLIKIDPHGILLIFIPILVFEAAYNTDLYFFKKEFYQVILLAGPGVAIGAIILGLFFSYALGYGEEFNIFGSFTFSSIITATDTIAVLSLLKELGTPKYFSMMFEGENLLNDATAMVFMMVFSSLYKAQGMTAFGAVLQFLRLSIGGLLLGGFIFLLTMLWLRRITKDKILVITITIISCYLTFFLAENVVKVSGLLSVVVLGVLMAMHAKMRMNPEALETVHIIISFICFCLESTVFLITGVFIGKMYIFQDKNTLEAADYTKSLIFFLAMNVARYVMIMILLPLINSSGYPLNWKDTVILAYGGVRGALGLALALMIYRDPEYPTRFRDIALFFTAVMIVLSVIFNGMTIGYLMKMIGFAPPNPLTQKIKNNVMKNMVIETIKKKNGLKENKFLKLADWNEVKNSCGLEKIIKEQLKDISSVQLKDITKQPGELRRPLKEEDFDKTEVQEVRMRVYNLIKSIMYEKFEENFCSINTLKSLNGICDVCLEDLNKPLWLWENMSQELLSIEEIMSLNKIRKIPIIGRFTSGYFSRFFLNTYEMLSMTVMVLNQFLDEKPEIPLNYNIVEMVYKEVLQNKMKFESRLFYLCDLFPDFITIVQNKQATLILLNTQKSVVQESYENGYITEEDYLKMSNQVDKEIAALDIKSYNWNKKEINELELVEPTFSKLKREDLELIRSSYTKLDFSMGSKIYSVGEPVKGAYIIIRGMVEDMLSLDCKITLGVGGIASFANIVSVTGKSITTLECIKDCSVYLVPKDIILQLADRDLSFRKYIYQNALYYYLKIYGSLSFSQVLNDGIIATIVDTAELITKSQGEAIMVEGGGFLFKGTLRPMEMENHAGRNELQVDQDDDDDHKEGSSGSPVTNRSRKAAPPSIRNSIIAPMLINPLMCGPYKVDRDIIYYSFRNSGIAEELDAAGVVRFSVRNLGSVANIVKRGSINKKFSNEHDIDREFKAIVSEVFPQLVGVPEDKKKAAGPQDAAAAPQKAA